MPRPLPPPTRSRRHPRLTHNRHVNEHLTFCAMHKQAARDRSKTSAVRASHREAAALHLLQAAHHFRTLR